MQHDLPKKDIAQINAIEGLYRKAIRGGLTHILLMALPVFIAAGTLNYRQGWVLLIIYSLALLGIITYLMKYDTKLLQRRMQVGGEKDKSQRLIQPFMFLAFGITLVLPALDHRFHWSTVPVGVEAIGNVLFALGLLTIFFVFKQNTYASAIIEIAAEQKIIDTGLYGMVRHPMYSGGALMLIGVPLALGSWWGLLGIVPSTLVLMWRIVEEEKVLIKSLPGYADYRQRVKYRLLPFIW